MASVDGACVPKHFHIGVDLYQLVERQVLIVTEEQILGLNGFVWGPTSLATLSDETQTA
jgi:hypothetical protein